MLRLTRAQVRAVDQIAIDRYHVPGIVLMENAALGASDVAWQMVDRTPNARVQILCGGGNNGGDGLAIARHLHNRGCHVKVALATDPARYKGDALINYRIVSSIDHHNLEVGPADPSRIDNLAALIIDALFGTGLSKPLGGLTRDLVLALNAAHTTVLAIDLPSGLDCDTGEPIGDVCVRAERTVTFVAEKSGFANSASRAYTGDITVADIGCPRQAIDDALRA
ncbi:MAG TPA: NAD(P)H-hydrate epimerase [Tepidisphaeraceae bacterium]|nr:NAD(P)H-hydrate epimerase [Tepidisphaeraceae bacterium]